MIKQISNEDIMQYHHIDKDGTLSGFRIIGIISKDRANYTVLLNLYMQHKEISELMYIGSMDYYKPDAEKNMVINNLAEKNIDKYKEKYFLYSSATSIKELRTIAGMSQSELAQYFRIPVKTVQNWEQGLAKTPEYIIPMMSKLLQMKKEDQSTVL